MNQMSVQVKQGSTEMRAGNSAILEEMARLHQMTGTISDAVNVMSDETVRITESIQQVTGMAGRTKEEILALGQQVSRFKV